MRDEHLHHKIPPDQVKTGMYVRGFGGPWLDHPFWLSRFVVRDSNLARIRESGVPYVVIDDKRGLSPVPAADDIAKERLPAPRGASIDRLSPRTSGRISSLQDGYLQYQKGEQKSERQRAVALVSRSLKVVRRTFTDARLGRALRLAEVVKVVDEVVETMERSPRTLLEVIRLKKKDEYTYLHSVAVCTLMVNMAAHLGKDEQEIRDFGLAGLLHDIGKMGIPDDILNKQGDLTDTEFDTVRNHPEHGYQLLLKMPNIPEMALDVCRHHHERVDGCGYPFALPEQELSLVARLGAICDVYDALTSDRAYKGAWTPVEAVAEMWNWEGHFDRSLLFTFMRSIAVFPAGMLVQLRSNRLGIVQEQKRRNSRPRVLAFYSTRERRFIETEEVVISDALNNDSILAAASSEEWGLGECRPPCRARPGRKIRIARRLNRRPLSVSLKGRIHYRNCCSDRRLAAERAGVEHQRIVCRA